MWNQDTETPSRAEVPDVHEDRVMGMLAWKGTGRGGTPHLRGGTLEFQQDQGAGTLHDVEIKQEGFVPGLAEGNRVGQASHLSGPEMAQRVRHLAPGLPT